MNWPVFAENEVIVLNKDAPVGVCALWSPKEEVVSRWLDGAQDKVSIVGNLYSVYGIGIMVRNFLANPALRHLVVTGTEFGQAKNALQNLLAQNAAKEFFLERWHLERFLEQVNIFYAEKKDVAGLIGGNQLGVVNLEKIFEPIIVPLPEPKSELFPAQRSGHLLRARTIEEGYYALLKEIRLFGHITKEDSEKNLRQEIWELNMVITSQNPTDFDSMPHPEYSKKDIEDYCNAFWQGNEPEDLAYRYGHIIRCRFGDQVDAVAEAFKQKAETFRTVISLWDPNVLSGSIVAKDPPCITLIHPRIIGNLLHLFTYIRTNDMWNGWPSNAAALRYFQFKLCEKVRADLNRSDIEVGDLDITSGSAHIYKRDWVRVDAALKKAPAREFFSDPKGNFNIKVENGEIKVEHYSPDGVLLQVFKGKNAEKLSMKIAPFVSQIKNALYIGRELSRAEALLKM